MKGGGEAAPRLFVSELPEDWPVAHPFVFRKMNALEVELSGQAWVAVDHDPPVQVCGNLFQVIGDLPVGLPRLSKVNGSRRLMQDPAYHFRFIGIILRRRDDDQVFYFFSIFFFNFFSISANRFCFF